MYRQATLAQKGARTDFGQNEMRADEINVHDDTCLLGTSTRNVNLRIRKFTRNNCETLRFQLHCRRLERPGKALRLSMPKPLSMALLYCPVLRGFRRKLSVALFASGLTVYDKVNLSLT